MVLKISTKPPEATWSKLGRSVFTFLLFVLPMELTPYHARYFAHELTKWSGSASVDGLTSVLADAQVDLNPHEVEAALFAFRSPRSQGAILADEVGLGKAQEPAIKNEKSFSFFKMRLRTKRDALVADIESE